MTDKQQTLGAVATYSGKGLHTGATVNLTIRPAAENHGIKFCRTDLDGSPVIDAVADHVSQTSRSTLLKKGDATVSTVEHLMAALWGCGVDNALIEVDPETRKFRYTAEYYAVKHFSHYVVPGSEMVGYSPKNKDGVLAVAYLTPEKKYVVVAGNFGGKPGCATFRLGKKFLNVTLAPHSLNTFVMR